MLADTKMYKIVDILKTYIKKKNREHLENIYWLFVKQFITCYMKWIWMICLPKKEFKNQIWIWFCNAMNKPITIKLLPWNRALFWEDLIKASFWMFSSNNLKA